MTIVQLFDLFARRHRLTFLVVLLAAAVAATAVALSMPKEYRAEATLVVGDSRAIASGASSVQSDEVLTRTYASLLQTSSVERDVLAALPFRLDRGALADEVAIEVVTATRLIRISTLDREPRRAQQLADAYAQTFVRRQQRAGAEAGRAQRDELLGRIGRLTAELGRTRGGAEPVVERRARLAAELDALRETYRTTEQNSALQGSNVAVASGATVPTTPAKPRTKLNLAVGLLFALALAVAAVLVRNVFDERLHGEDELADLLRAPILARIPLDRGGGGAARAAVQDATDVLRTVLRLRDDDPTAIAVVGATSDEGKTTVVSLLATAFARAGERVVAVDCDLRHPQLTERLDAEGSGRGVTNVLVEKARDPLELVAASRSHGVSVLPAGPVPPNPSVLLGLPRLRALFLTLLGDFDAVVVDCAPTTAGADTMAVASAVGRVLVVVDLRTARRGTLAALRDDLDRSGAEVVGVVLNRVRPGDRRHRSTLVPATPRVAAPGRAPA